MNKEFIPYEEALALKELGFNEECLIVYSDKGELSPIQKHGVHNSNVPSFATAPLYQQAFRWFREKHNIFAYVDPNYCYKIWVDDEFFEHSVDHHNYEEAELECIKQLIKIVKEKK